MNKPTVRTTTVARVTVTVEVEVGSWGPDCRIEQVYRQGVESAVGRVRQACARDSSIKVVGAGKVLAVTTSLESKL